MYPAAFFSLFPPFPMEDKVFVAMAFKPFRNRWEKVIEPAINEIGLKPHRVDASMISDSILTEILAGIGKCRLVFADVSAVEGEFRNGNVMYEVGIAHAMRQPQEVVLFRSDEKRLLFDISNIRVNSYDPDADPGAAKQQVKDALTGTLKEIDITKGLAVKRVVDALDQGTFWILAEAVEKGAIGHPTLLTMGQIVGNSSRLQSISRLLELGLITTRYPKISPESLKELGDKQFGDLCVYIPTPLGKAVVDEIANRIGMNDPKLARRLEELFGGENPSR